MSDNLEAIIGILNASELGFGFLVSNSQINEFLLNANLKAVSKKNLNCRADRLQLTGALSLFIANLRLRRNRRIGRRHNTDREEKIQLKDDMKEARIKFMTRSRAPP